MDAAIKDTHFAPAERLPIEAVLKQREQLEKHLDKAFLDTIPAVTLVLNTHRQIVFANSALFRTLGLSDQDAVLGVRAGELLGCIHSSETLAGCGTSESCRQCGAIRAVLGTHSGKPSEEEARILVKTRGMINALNLQVHALPVVFDDQSFTIVYLSDRSDNKRKDAVERIFFHDMLNALGGIIGAVNLIHDEETSSDVRELADMVLERANFLTQEIQAHRMLDSAERSQLEVEPSEVDPEDVLRRIVKMSSGSVLAQHKTIMVRARPGARLATDKGILTRILENLLKNALEACLPGQTVEIGFRDENGRIIFFVKSPAYIPREIQHQIFQRSFSTKGKGRGLGTYSVKMLTVNYLRGEVDFTSTIEDGTTFFVRLPHELPESS